MTLNLTTRRNLPLDHFSLEHSTSHNCYDVKSVSIFPSSIDIDEGTGTPVPSDFLLSVIRFRSFLAVFDPFTGPHSVRNEPCVSEKMCVEISENTISVLEKKLSWRIVTWWPPKSSLWFTIKLEWDPLISVKDSLLPGVTSLSCDSWGTVDRDFPI